MNVALGIDTGGTYTDAVLLEQSSGQVLCAAKALTTRRDLALGIGQAIDAVFRQPLAGERPRPGDVTLTALSTTLATNAIVEGQGSPLCLVLIGYDPELIRQYHFEQELVTDDVVYIGGGHDIHGDEAAPLDEAALRRAVLARRGRVEAFGVSGYFGVRNPAHELRAKALVAELSGLPVTTGHELTTRLDSVRRATTVALNARLIPLLRELIETLRRTLQERAITAPLMVVKGDGSLVQAEWAMRRPIETILSGPAASAVGAWHLAAQDGESFDGGALWVVDVGGTTTDIAALRQGRPRLNPAGAQVGRWRTMVEAVDVHTVGLGGDSHVRLDGERLLIGPRRVMPLSLLADQHPEVLDELRNQAAIPPRADVAGQFLVSRRRPSRRLGDDEEAILKRLAAPQRGLGKRGPLSLAALVRESRFGSFVLRRVDDLLAERLVLRAAFTPTDALHTLGRLALWNVEAAVLGAKILAVQRKKSGPSCAPQVPSGDGCAQGTLQGRRGVDDLCRAVVEGVSHRAATALVTKILSDEAQPPAWEQEPTAALLLDRALSAGDDHGLDCALTLRQPVVAIGAPVAAYMPLAAERLHTRLVVPPYAEVANAVGAVVGGVVQRQRVLIVPLEGGGAVRLHLPQGPHDLADVEEAVAYAQEQMWPWMEELARQAGAAHVEVQMTRQDREVQVRAGWGDRIYLGSELTFTAVGRPSPAV